MQIVMYANRDVCKSLCMQIVMYANRYVCKSLCMQIVMYANRVYANRGRPDLRLYRTQPTIFVH
jgi:hypothetical protein